MSKKILPLLGVSVVSLSVICGISGIKTLKTNEPSSTTRANAETEGASVTSIKEAITKLANAKNYTVQVTTKTGPLNITNNMFYTENAFYDDYLGDEYGYVKCDAGVYRFDRYARRFTPSALIKDSKGKTYNSIWGNEFFYSFNDLDLSEFNDANGKSFVVTKKKNKLVFMKMFSIAQSQYQNLNGINVLVDDSVNTVTFSVSLKNGEKHDCIVKDFGTTKIDYLDKQLNQGKSYYVPDASMQKIIDLFADYNYTHFIFDEKYSKTKYAGFEKFDRDYFYSAYTSEYISFNANALLATSGMVGLDNYVVNDKVTMNGSYYVSLWGDQISFITTFYYNKDPFVPNVYKYPTFLNALTSSQYFENAGTEGKYYTTKLSVISDFCNNFQLWDALNENNFVPCGLYVTYDKSYNNQDTVTFSIEYDYFGYKGTTDYVFSDFGTTKEQVLEQKYVKKYMQAYYNGTKAKVSVEGQETKALEIYRNKNWLLDDNILEANSYEYYKDASAGSTISFTLTDGSALNATPRDVATNNNYVVENGVYKIKDTANTTIILYKMVDGSYQFEARKA
jgi:hypothetical protein